MTGEGMLVGGAVLCGGRSSRMGLSKAMLPFGGERMLQRVVRRLAEAVRPLVVVAAPGQELPELPDHVVLAYDRREGQGPLEGLLAGLTALRPRANAAFVTSCDVPLLAPAFVRRLVGLLEDYDIVVPVEAEYHHPLAAVYRTAVCPVVERLLEEDRRRPLFLFDQVNTRRVPVEDLREVDPHLQSLRNLNEPADYLAALADAGLEAPPDVAGRLRRQ